VCLSVCLRAYPPNHTHNLYQFFVCDRGSVVHQRGDKIPRGRDYFGGLSVPFKSTDNLRCTSSCSVAAKGIFQSPITSCSRRDHSVCQASANNILQMSGRRRCGLSATDGVVDCTARATDTYDCLVLKYFLL